MLIVSVRVSGNLFFVFWFCNIQRHWNQVLTLLKKKAQPNFSFLKTRWLSSRHNRFFKKFPFKNIYTFKIIAVHRKVKNFLMSIFRYWSKTVGAAVECCAFFVQIVRSFFFFLCCWFLCFDWLNIVKKCQPTIHWHLHVRSRAISCCKKLLFCSVSAGLSLQGTGLVSRSIIIYNKVWKFWIYD